MKPGCHSGIAGKMISILCSYKNTKESGKNPEGKNNV
jgi:hypothetical protein